MIGRVVYLFEECRDWLGMQKADYSGYDIDGNKITNNVEGLHARVIQQD